MNRIYSFRLSGVLVLSLLFGGCSGGGGGDPIEESHTVGGTVTGLTGSGLVLQNNGGDDLAISADGSFTFAMPLVDGSSYAVTVLTQPSSPNQTCSVTNGSGTVAGANVTNVAIVCTTNTYTIGGSVTGVTGSGLVLQNNGGDDLAISSDGSFTFATPLADGSSYAVTILSHPSGITCTASYASGVVIGADITSVAITCSKVSPLYSTNGNNWNDYVKDDGSNSTNATDTACDAASDTACLHGGEMRVVELVALSSCAGVTAVDTLGTFDWSCDDSTGAARLISTGLAPGYGLADLVDFFTIGWKNNSLIVYKDSSVYEITTPAVWWENSVVSNTSGGTLDVAGTVYAIPSTATATYLLAADKVSLVAAPGVEITGASSGLYSYVIGAIGLDFLWLEGMAVNASNVHNGVAWSEVRFSVMRDLAASHALYGDEGYGVSLGVSSYNRLSNISVSDNRFAGVALGLSWNNMLSNVVAHNNITHGFFLDNTSHNNQLSNVTASNNNTGFSIDGVSDNTFSNMTASNNEFGIKIAGALNNTISGVTTSNNNTGVTIWRSSNNTVSSVASSNNEIGIWLGDGGVPSNQTIADLIASDNNVGIMMLDASSNYFTGELKMGNNSSLNCDVVGGTDPGLVNITCANQGASDATLTTGITTTDSFVSKIVADDTVNTSDTNGAATITDTTVSFDWAGFDNLYRSWGINGGAFPDASNRGAIGCSANVINGSPVLVYTNQVDCEAASGIWSGDARIWDWSLLTTGTVAKAVHTLPTGNDTLTHIWSDSSTTTFLRHAIEIQGDGVGNDNTLCETGETCLYTPNMGAYQGHGNLISADTFIDGTITGVTLMKYENNGY